MALTQIKTTGIADDAVTEAKVANDAIGTAEMKAGTDGHIITYDASGNPTTVGPGTDGQVLTSTGAGSPPAFETPAASPITALNNATANELVTVGSTTTELDAESSLTFDGNQLYIDCGYMTEPIIINSVQSSVRATIRQTNDANANSGLAIQKKHSTLHPANHWYGDISFEGWDGSGYHKGGLIECVAEGTPANDNMPGGLRFSTNPGQASPTEKLRITKDGDVQVKTGNLVISTAGKGIDFSATSDVAGMTSELLDDYEEGSFTPSWQMTQNSPSITYYDQQGQYTKIGRVVHFQIYLRINAVNANGSGILYVSGLPFTAVSNTGQGPAFGCVTFGYMDTVQGMNSQRSPHGYVEANDSKIYMYQFPNGSGHADNMTVANNLTNNTKIMMSGSYQTS